MSNFCKERTQNAEFNRSISLLVLNNGRDSKRWHSVTLPLIELGIDKAHWGELSNLRRKQAREKYMDILRDRSSMIFDVALSIGYKSPFYPMLAKYAENILSPNKSQFFWETYYFPKASFTFEDEFKVATFTTVPFRAMEIILTTFEALTETYEREFYKRENTQLLIISEDGEVLMDTCKLFRELKISILRQAGALLRSDHIKALVSSFAQNILNERMYIDKYTTCRVDRVLMSNIVEILFDYLVLDDSEDVEYRIWSLVDGTEESQCITQFRNLAHLYENVEKSLTKMRDIDGDLLLNDTFSFAFSKPIETYEDFRKVLDIFGNCMDLIFNCKRYLDDFTNVEIKEKEAKKPKDIVGSEEPTELEEIIDSVPSEN